MQNCESCAFKNPKGTATAIIIKDNKVLLLKRNEEPFKGMMDLPGGYMQEGETPEITVTREVMEELGVEPKEVTLMKMFAGTAYWKDSSFPVISHFYLVDIGNQEIKLNDESSEYSWTPLKELAYMNLPMFIAFDSNQEFVKYLAKNFTFDLVRVVELVKQLDSSAVLNEQALYKAVINGRVATFKDGDKLVAMGWIYPRQTMLRHQAVIEDMICDMDYRGQGLGQKILTELLNWAKLRGVEVVELTSGWHREAAHGLYKKNGFQIHDTAHMLKVLK